MGVNGICVVSILLTVKLGDCRFDLFIAFCQSCIPSLILHMNDAFALDAIAGLVRQE